MNISKNSKQMMLFFTQNNYIHKVKHSKRTNGIIGELYKYIYQAHIYLTNLKQSGQYYNIATNKITNASHITRPKTFNLNSFPEEVRTHINKYTMTEISYNFSLYGRNVKIYFIIEDHIDEVKIETFNKYIDTIIMWLYILNQCASKQCATSLVVYFYFTSLEKKLPLSNMQTLDEIHINTAFTTTCPKDSEIVIFRKEEWFKVFIHETFHNFSLDFSDMNNNEAHHCILDIFKVNSDVNLYESYTECWAEIMNALFCSFFSIKDKTDTASFLSNSEFFINFERNYSFFQVVKALQFMGLQYKSLYSTSAQGKTLRDNLYKEKTSVLSYYVIKTVLLNNYQGFLFWCKTNNPSLLQFKKTIENQREYCKFIGKNYKSISMLDGIYETEKFLNSIQKGKQKKNNYILSNLRMSICEMG